MTKIKFDLTGSDPDKAKLLGNTEQPRPGVYRCKVTEVNPGFSKDNNGKPDQSRPRVEVVFEVQDAAYKGASLWYYLTYGEGFPIQKQDQFLQAFGIASSRKRKGEWDTDKVVGKYCLVRVKAGKNLSDEYKADVSAVMPDGDHEEVTGSGGSAAAFGPANDDDWDGGEAFEDETSDDTLSDDEDIEAAQQARREELTAMKPAELKAVAKDADITLGGGKKKAEVIEEIIAAEYADPDEAGDDEMLGDDDELSDDDDDTIEVSEESLKAMPVEELKSTALAVGVDIKGKKKSEVIAAILAAAEGDDGDEPF